jgi:hypothetical protein
MKSPRDFEFFFLLVLFPLFLAQPARAEYKKIDPPPDANKVTTGSDDTCWLATAANMLAGAGYGYGNNVQEQADSIYTQLKTHFAGTT